MTYSGQADAQDETQPARGTEIGGSKGADHADCQAGATDDSGQLESESQRVARTAWQGASKFIGGILTRLLSDKEERIREVKAYITWYEDELAKREAELADLQQFADQVSQDPEG